MKVWVIGRGYPRRDNNMLGSFELEQAKMLAKAGMDVTYLSLDIRSIRRLRRFGTYCKTEDGVKLAFYSLPIGPILSREKRLKLYVRLMRKLVEKTGKRYGLPDIIHVHYPSTLSYEAVEDCQNKGCRIVATEHWTKVQNKTCDDYARKNVYDFFSKADAMCCVGAALAESIRELTGIDKNIYIVPNVVSEAFRPTTEKHEGFRFVCAGRLVPVKQFDRIVEAFLDVFQGNENVSLTLAGNGEDYAKIKAIISDRKAEKLVSLLGSVSREKMSELVASSDAMVVFSNLETFCVPVIEAWACGIPVIATETTVFADNPDTRLGIMVDCNNIETLKPALKYLYEHRDEYDPEWIRQYALSHFSEEAVSRCLAEIYTCVSDAVV